MGRADQRQRSPPSIEGQGCKSGGRATKVVRLNLGGLCRVPDSGLGEPRGEPIAAQKSAEGIVGSKCIVIGTLARGRLTRLRRPERSLPRVRRVNGVASRTSRLMSGKRQKNQLLLAFAAEGRGESPMAAAEGTELPVAKRDAESPTQTDSLMEEVCQRDNLWKALKRVQANKGAPGVDGMTVRKLPKYLKRHWPKIREQLLAGTYRPQPVKRVEIPKPDGGVRKLGIPTALDRFIQQAVLQVLQARWDRTFSEHSYGFRPGRSAHQAVAQAQAYIAEGYGVHRGHRPGEVLRPGQPRHADGPRRQAGGRQATAQTHSGVPERRGDGERAGESVGRRDAARRPSFAAAVAT